MVSIIHLYAKQYGWTRDYILDSVYLDEHILQHKLIKDDERNDWLMQSYIALLPNFEDKAREEFLESLQKEEEDAYKKSNVKQVSFEETKRAIEQAQQQLKSM